MHFGLEQYVGIVLYLSAIGAFLLTIFWKPIVGIYYLVPLIPLQTIRYRLNAFPLGASVVGLMLLAIALGLKRQGRPLLPKTFWTKLLCIYIVFTFLSLWYGAFYLRSSLPLPGDVRFANWQEYITLPVMLLLVAALEPNPRQIKTLVILMCLATLALDHNFWNVVSDRDFSSYSVDLREGSSMGYAGSNGLAAFEAQVVAFLLALAAFERGLWLRIGYYALAFFSAMCLMYSLSRGGYVALLVGLLFMGLVKQRKLLLGLILFVCVWTSIVPPAVQQRVRMSYSEQTGTVDNSAETRLVLWKDAMDLFYTSPVWGTGYNTYAYMHRERRTDGWSGYYADTHNIYMKVLVETGASGLVLFLWLLLTTFAAGYRLFRVAKNDYFAALGLGLAGWVLCAATASAFGDRWTFLQINGFMWILGGLVAQAWKLERNSAEETQTTHGESMSELMLDRAAPQPTGIR
jgi:O-antigen ligase